MFTLSSLLFGAQALAAFHMPHFNLDKEIHLTEREAFVRHEGKGKFDNWVGLNVPVAPLQKLLRQIEVVHQVRLTARPEAHITVLTPPEYWLLQPTLPMDRINHLLEQRLQHTKFEVVCLGRGEAIKNEKREQTFFVVVNSPDLIEIRKKIQETFLSEGGKGGINPEEFFPHITVGYTKQDLHYEDGVIKDFRACVAHLD